MRERERDGREWIAPDMLSSIQVLTGLEVFKLCQREVDIDTQITKMTISINGTVWLHVRLQQSGASVLFSYITFLYKFSN